MQWPFIKINKKNNQNEKKKMKALLHLMSRLHIIQQ